MLVIKIYINYSGRMHRNYYILDKENQLYKIDVTYLAWNGYHDHTYVEKVSRVKEILVSSIEETKDTIKVTFKDGKSETLKVNIEGYGVYQNLE